MWAQAEGISWLQAASLLNTEVKILHDSVSNKPKTLDSLSSLLPLPPLISRQFPLPTELKLLRVHIGAHIYKSF